MLATINFINRCILFTVILLLLLFTRAAIAQDCQISSNASTVDYGRLTYDNTVQSEKKQILSERTVQFTVNCSETKAFVLYFDSERTQNGDFLFGSAGTVNLQISSGMLDGRQVQFSNFNKSELTRDTRVVLPGESIEARAGITVERGRTLSFNVLVEPRVARNVLRSRDAIPLESRIYVRVETKE